MNSKLILTLDGEIINEYQLNADTFSIGRKHNNNIQLNDLTVSGRHAMLTRTQPDQAFIEDLCSTNGTLVNGNHIKKRALRHGDIVQIGHHQFTFLDEETPQYEPTMFIKAELDETQMVLPDWESLEESIKGQPLAGLRTLNGPMARTVMELRKPFSTIGFQGQKMALISRGLSDYAISPVATSPKSRRVSDYTLLNGEELNPAATPLKSKDIISISGFEVEFYFIH